MTTSNPGRVLRAHAEVHAGLRDQRLGVTVPSLLRDAGIDWMLNHDGDVHRRLHRAMARAFTPGSIHGLRTVINARVQALVTDLRRAGSVDIVSSFAFRLPIETIRHLFGASELEPEQVHHWWRAMMVAYGDNVDEFAAANATTAAAQFRLAIEDVIARRRTSPKDDVLTALLTAGPEDALDHEELVGNAMLVIGAGFETTMGLISNGIWLLATHPSQRCALLEDPGLIGSTIEEVLRLESPIISVARVATSPLVVGDTAIEAGDRVVLDLAAANRDPRVFTNPTLFDNTRSPNPHLAFGGGPHFCLGAALARLEGTLALGTLFERLPGLQLAEETVTWTPHPILRCPERLVVTVGSRSTP